MALELLTGDKCRGILDDKVTDTHRHGTGTAQPDRQTHTHTYTQKQHTLSLSLFRCAHGQCKQAQARLARTLALSFWGSEERERGCRAG
jgi:hypothetical protein